MVSGAHGPHGPSVLSLVEGPPRQGPGPAPTPAPNTLVIAALQLILTLKLKIVAQILVQVSLTLVVCLNILSLKGCKHLCMDASIVCCIHQQHYSVQK